MAFQAPTPDLATFQPEGMRIEMLKAEALPGSKGLTRLHLEMRLPCPVWGAMNVTGPVKAWSLAAEPPEVGAVPFPLAVISKAVMGMHASCVQLFLIAWVNMHYLGKQYQGMWRC